MSESAPESPRQLTPEEIEAMRYLREHPEETGRALQAWWRETHGWLEAIDPTFFDNPASGKSTEELAKELGINLDEIEEQ